MSNRFNLIDEPWIPIADVDRVSLRQVFSVSEYRALGGNPVQKIAVMKLLLAIAQSACTPKDEEQWRGLEPEGLARRCLAYLDQWHDRFYLYGSRPFLQMPEIARAEKQNYGAVLPEVSSGNTTVLSQVQVERPLADADKALLLLTLMAFALGGKKTDNSVVLSPGYAGKSNDKGKPSTGKAGPGMAFQGLLHSFLLGDSLLKTVWLNLLSEQQIVATNLYAGGLGRAPWEQMPDGEDCPVARQLKQSLMGRLVPLSRFCLLDEDGLHYSEGLAHADYNSGMVDPSVAVDFSTKKVRALWVNPEKRPWRELTALLHLLSQQKNQGFQCLQIDIGLRRAGYAGDILGLWSGGLSVSSNAGEQYIRGSDDYVESQVWLHSDALGEIWFAHLQAEMTALDDLSKALYGCVMGYFKALLVDAKQVAAQATHSFWELCERHAQDLLDACRSDEEGVRQRHELHLRFADAVNQSFDRYCPRDTARQIDAWARARPNLTKYLKQEA